MYSWLPLREISKVIIAYPDRLTIFGFKILEEFFKSYGTEIVMVNEREADAPKAYIGL